MNLPIHSQISAVQRVLNQHYYENPKDDDMNIGDES